MLSQEQATVLFAFLTSFDELTGVWTQVEELMREQWSIEEPEEALEDARQALQQMM